MPPHIVETAREAMAVRPRGRMSAGPETDTKLPAIRVPINPARSPNRVPAAEKITRTIYSPATSFSLDTGIIKA